MNRKILVTTIGLLAVGAATSALAQESKPVGLSVRAGLFFPSSSNARDIGKSWFAGGADFRLKDMNLGTTGASSSSAELTVSADYYGKDNATTVPVLLNFVGHNNETYYTAGVGVGFNRFPDTAGGTNNTTRLAYQIGLGYNFQQGKSPLFLEARYWGSSNSDLNGVAVYVGIHL